MGDLFFFFFSSRRRHTRLQGDWSSDVCSSDLSRRSSRSKHRSSPRSDTSAATSNRWCATWWSLRSKWSAARSEEHTSESSHLVISYAVFCLKQKKCHPLPTGATASPSLAGLRL